MENQELLEHIGLSEKESLVYLTLLESGTLSIAALAEHSGMHRPALYKLLPRLEGRGLVSRVRKNRRVFFVAESPEKLETLVQGIAHSFEQTLPILKQVYAAKEKRPLIKFLTGRKGIIFVYEDIITTLKKGEIFYRYSSSKNARRDDWYVPKNYRERRDKKQIERFVITNEKTQGRKKPRLERYTKVVPKDYDLWDYNITQLIYADKVAFVDYNTETAIIIENPIIAEFQRKIFKLLFKKL